MTDAVLRSAQGERAKQALSEFIAPAFTVIRDEYRTKLQEIAATRAMTGEPLMMVQKLATALKIADQVEAQIIALISDGEAANAELDRAGNIARLPAAQRRYAEY